jgi:hypothetical protein
MGSKRVQVVLVVRLGKMRTGRLNRRTLRRS